MEGQGAALARRFEFPTFQEAVAFVNAVAWQAHRDRHHPDIELYYRQVTIRYRTHAIGALSETDFACAARIDALIPPL